MVGHISSLSLDYVWPLSYIDTYINLYFSKPQVTTYVLRKEKAFSTFLKPVKEGRRFTSSQGASRRLYKICCGKAMATNSNGFQLGF
jgi:hypothetical protein